MGGERPTLWPVLVKSGRETRLVSFLLEPDVSRRFKERDRPGGEDENVPEERVVRRGLLELPLTCKQV